MVQSVSPEPLENHEGRFGGFSRQPLRFKEKSKTSNSFNMQMLDGSIRGGTKVGAQTAITS